MKINPFLKYVGIALIMTLTMIACQDMDEPKLGDYPQDGPTISLITPNESGTTTIQTLEEVAPITFEFEVMDDIKVANIKVVIDEVEFANLSDFENNQHIVINDLVYEGVTTGEHSVVITAVDSDGNETIATTTFSKIVADPYNPAYGESFYMPFDNNFYEVISLTAANEVNTPSFANEAHIGDNAYRAGTDNYITYPSEGLTTTEFSATFWYKVDSSTDRAGILVIGDENNPESRTQGFRLLREGNTTNQRIKLNVGTGTAESWNNGGEIDVTANEWVHVAMVISETESMIYLNGELANTATLTNPISWNGCNTFTIGAGGDTFSYWNHLSDTSAMDDLKFFPNALSQAEINIVAGLAYEPLFESETFYLPFNGNYTDAMSFTDAMIVGTPTFADEAYVGSNAYMGAVDSYLTFPIDNLFATEEFSTTFWYKVNATPDRAGILVVGDNEDDRFQGFRIFREGNADEQRIKLNIGLGSSESWNDGGVIDATLGDWVHVAITVSATESKIYLNGELQKTVEYSTPIDWTGCSEMVIGASGPTFSYWNHLSDLSVLDELRIYNTVLTLEEIQTIL